MDIDTTLSISSVPGPERRRGIPQPSLYRLPQYHHYLSERKAKGTSRISCSVIGRDLNLVPVQVRKDLQYTGIVGKPKTGYSVPELIQAIETFLGWNNVNEAFLVGAGNLGTALLGHERFSNLVCALSRRSIPIPKRPGNGFTKRWSCRWTSWSIWRSA